MAEKPHSSVLQTAFARARLFVLLPESKEEDFDKLWTSLTSERRGSDSVEQSQRRHLFLDEVVRAYVILQTAIPIEDDVARELGRHVTVSVDAFAIGSRKSTTQQEQELEQGLAGDVAEDHVFSWINDDVYTPGLIPGHQHDDVDASSKVTALYWQVELHMDSARIRSQYPSLYLSANAKIPQQKAQEAKPGDVELEYLPSGVPVNQNSLPPLRNASQVAGDGSDDGSEVLKADSGPPIRMTPAFRSRVRICRTEGSENMAKAFASLEFIASPFISDYIELDQPSVSLSNGIAKAIGNDSEHMTSYRCKSQDKRSFVYELTQASRNPDTPNTLTVILTANIVSSSTKANTLKSTYKTFVDLPSPYLTELSTTSRSNLLTVTISAPAKVHVNETSRWTVLAANNHATDPILLKISPVVQPQEDTNGVRTAPKLLSLSPDLHVGPLDPGACVGARLDFRALQAGLAKPEAIRIESAGLSDDNGNSAVEGKVVDLKGECLPDVIAYDVDLKIHNLDA